MKDLLSASLMVSLAAVQPERNAVSEPNKTNSMHMGPYGCHTSCVSSCEGSCKGNCTRTCQFNKR